MYEHLLTLRCQEVDSGVPLYLGDENARAGGGKMSNDPNESGVVYCLHILWNE